MANKVFKRGSTVEYTYDTPTPQYNMFNVYIKDSIKDNPATYNYMTKYNNQLFSAINGPNGFLLKADVPTKVSDLINDSNFQTDTEVQSAINTALAGFVTITFEFVSTLPATGQAGTFYMIPNGGTGNNTFDEYVYANNRFEKIGTTEVDLSGYLQTSMVASKGSAIQPVYFDSNGEAQPTTFELNKTVPANAEFTDTTYTQGTGINIDSNNEISNTGVLSASEGTVNGAISFNIGGTNVSIPVHGLGTMAFEDASDYVTTTDAVTDVAEGTGNGQIAVTKDGTTTQVSVHGLGSAAYTDSTDYLEANTTYAGSATVGGSANSAVRLDASNVGSATKGVYIDSNGQPVAMTHTVEEDVPSGAVFTDTTYSQGTGINIDSNNVISTTAEENVQSDWNETNSTSDAYIQNKPTLGTASAKDFTTSVTSGSGDLITSGAVYTELDAKVDKTSIGSANGVAELDSTGKIPSSQLPSFVDDVIEGYLHTDGKFYEEAAHTTEITGESSKIYVDLTDNLTYRWSGSAFVEISESIALGETSSTAYRGDRGKEAYDHSQVTSGNPHNVTATEVGLGSVVNTGDSDTPVSGGTTKFTTGGAYTELAKKQDVLTEGDNIDISVEGVISAIDTTYSQGTGIVITGSTNAINLSSSTLVSLGKADTALQSTDLVFATDADIDALFA